LSANETKRKDNPLTKRVIILGFLLGTLYTFLGIYLSYKVGIVALGGIFLLGYILLQLTGKYNYKENVILIIIVTSCLLPAFEISDNIAALVIYKDHLNQPIDLSFPLLFLLSAVGSILGIFLLMPFKSQFLKLKWGVWFYDCLFFDSICNNNFWIQNVSLVIATRVHRL